MVSTPLPDPMDDQVEESTSVSSSTDAERHCARTAAAESIGVTAYGPCIKKWMPRKEKPQETHLEVAIRGRCELLNVEVPKLQQWSV